MAKKYTPIMPNGTHLASSRDTTGAKRGTLLDNKTNKIVGQAEFLAEDEKDNDTDTLASGLLVGAAVVGIAAVGIAVLSKAYNESAVEHQKISEKEKIEEQIRLEEFREIEMRKSAIRMEQELIRQEKRVIRHATLEKYIKLGLVYCGKRIALTIKYLATASFWLTKKIFLAAKKISIFLYKKVKKSIQNYNQKNSINKNSQSQTIYESDVTTCTYVSMEPAQFTEIVDKTFEELQNNMSSEVAQMHLIKILILSNELGNELKKITNSNIYTNEKIDLDCQIWQSTMEKLTTDKAVGYINYVLSNYKNNIDPNLVNTVLTIFHGGIYSNQEYIPIRQEQIVEALKLG